MKIIFKILKKKSKMTDFLFDMIATELEDAVGRENCSTRMIDKVAHSVDYFWLSRMWADRGLRMPEGEFIVAPKDAKDIRSSNKIYRNRQIHKNVRVRLIKTERKSNLT